MKVTTAAPSLSLLDNPRHSMPRASAEESLISLIFQDGSGKRLIKFCRELSAVLVHSYRSEGGTSELTEKLCASLMVTLKCSEKQALSLIELSLELVHAKVKGAAGRSDIEISYLIATATGAVSDVSSN